ncbi:TPA: hypothetical protein N0F65_001320 [Lagenidium giganteum]|uniref:CNNM transmembrane domain-containing protein n=1 Tax=Lagenidium giganteum TaxID=4803 RepID=A0AAV2YZI5_9STRA|nr:TPA: hypothetical protein N0F65_001320 [Lagenidium giganteum]
MLEMVGSTSASRILLLAAVNGLAGTTRRLEAAESESSSMQALRIIALVILLLLSASFSGLGLGLMSLDLIGLEIVVSAGEDEHATPKEKKNRDAARRIIPIRQKGNLLLTTLLLGNVSVNSLTSILMADMTSGFLGFLSSTILIVLFGEIVPQALCTRHALVIGAKAVPFVRVLIAVFYIFAKPVSMVLDATLCEEIGMVFTKSQLHEMIEIHESQKMIDSDEGDILRGAMSYRNKHYDASRKSFHASNIPSTSHFCATICSTFVMVMHFLNGYELHVTAVLDQHTIQKIMESGFSRIPIFETNVNNIISVISVKDLVFVDPKEQAPALSSFIHVFGRSAHRVDGNCRLDKLLQIFKTEGEHLALVKNTPADVENEPFFQLEGVVTLEDVLEEILQVEILDEGDVADNGHIHDRKRQLSRQYGHGGRLSLADLCGNDGNDTNIHELAAHVQETNAVFQAKTTDGDAISTLSLADFFLTCPIVELGGDDGDSEDLLTKGVVASHCIIVLDGRVRVDHGNPTASEAGPWTVFAAESLTTQEGMYISDVSVRPHPEYRARCLRVLRSDFQQKLHPFGRRHSHAV